MVSHCDALSSKGVEEDDGVVGKTLRVNLTADEWKALRIRAAEQGVSVAALATELIRSQLVPQRKRGVKKPAPES
jgi:plasmid stability protein